MHLNKVLATFSLTREDILQSSTPETAQNPAGDKVAAAIRDLASRMPTYITLKDVKKRWGHRQEDVFPVAQFEKLWVDMTGLFHLSAEYVVVPRRRGQQLKEPAQLDGWLRDGSAEYVAGLCDFSND